MASNAISDGIEGLCLNEDTTCDKPPVMSLGAIPKSKQTQASPSRDLPPACLTAYLLACLLACLTASLLACLPSYLPAYLPACLLAYLPASLPACLLAYLPTCLLELS